MENNWNEYYLDEVYEFSSGLSKKREEFGFGFDFLSFKDVFNNYFIPNNLTELVNSNEKEREKYSVKRGDVFLTRTSETLNELGMSCVALRDYNNATFNGFTKRLRPNGKVDILPEYIGFYFRSKMFRNQVTSMASMTTRASLNNEMLARLKIVLPPIQIQKKIAYILKSIDNKINSNDEINSLLLDIMRNIYKEWFINYEPFMKKEKVISELGEIPNGWKVGTIGEYARVRSGYAFKSKWWTDEGIGVVKIKDINGNSVEIDSLSNVADEYVLKAKEFEVSSGDLLIAMTGATVGKVGVIPKNDKRIFVNQRVGKFFLGENPIEKVPFLFFTLSEKRVSSIIVSKAEGSAQPNISASEIENIPIVIPEKKVLNKFNFICMPMFEKYLNNLFDNYKLKDVRTLLLQELIEQKLKVIN